MCIYPAAAATLHQHQQDLRILHSAQLRELETVIAELRLGGSGEPPANVKHSYMSTQFATGWRKHIGSPNLQIISTKEPLNIGHFCRKWFIKIRDLMRLCHPVCTTDIELSCEKIDLKEGQGEYVLRITYIYIQSHLCFENNIYIYAITFMF